MQYVSFHCEDLQRKLQSWLLTNQQTTLLLAQEMWNCSNQCLMQGNNVQLGSEIMKLHTPVFTNTFLVLVFDIM